MRLLALGRLGGARVPPVAHRVHEPRLREDPRQPGRGGDREAAHLDHAPACRPPRRAGRAGRRTASGRPERRRRQQFASNRATASSKRSRRNDLVEATNLGHPARRGRQAHPGAPAVAPNPVPPEAAQLVEELRRRRLAGDHVSEAARIAVEAALDRDHLVARVLAEQPGDHVRAAAPRAADEDEVARSSADLELGGRRPPGRPSDARRRRRRPAGALQRAAQERRAGDPVGLEAVERLARRGAPAPRPGAPRGPRASARRWRARRSFAAVEEPPHPPCRLEAEEPAQRPQAGPFGPSSSSSSRLTVSRRSGGIAARPGVHRSGSAPPTTPGPGARVRGEITPRVWATREAEASRPSRTTWMNLASGNSRTRVGAWATVSVLCSTRPLARASVDPEPEQVAEEPPASRLAGRRRRRLESRRPPPRSAPRRRTGTCPACARSETPSTRSRAGAARSPPWRRGPRAAPESRAPRRGSGPRPGPARASGGGSAAWRARGCRFAPCRRRTRTAAGGRRTSASLGARSAGAGSSAVSVRRVS